MTDKQIALFVGAAAVLLYFLSRQSTPAAAGPGAGATAAVGDNPLGAASGTLDANGNPIGGLGSQS